jgi:hypothetical protein
MAPTSTGAPRNLAPRLALSSAVPVRPSRWRALPTALLVVGAILLGAATARADGAHRSAPAGPAAVSSSAAIR